MTTFFINGKVIASIDYQHPKLQVPIAIYCPYCMDIWARTFVDKPIGLGQLRWRACLRHPKSEIRNFSFCEPESGLFFTNEMLTEPEGLRGKFPYPELIDILPREVLIAELLWRG